MTRLLHDSRHSSCLPDAFAHCTARPRELAYDTSTSPPDSKFGELAGEATVCDLECSTGHSRLGCRRRGFRYLSMRRIQQHQASSFSPQLTLLEFEKPPLEQGCVHAMPFQSREIVGSTGGGVGPMRGSADGVRKRHIEIARPLQVSPMASPCTESVFAILERSCFSAPYMCMTPIMPSGWIRFSSCSNRPLCGQSI